jgi:2'-5' RNA ligase
MGNHWEVTAPGWRDGAPRLTWHITLGAHRELRGVATRLAPPLRRPFLDAVPLRWLHLTVHDVGSCAAVSPEDVDALAAAARERLSELPPVAVALGPPRVLDHAIALVAASWSPLQPLMDALADADRSVRGAASAPPARSDLGPHVSLAYANADPPAIDLPHVGGVELAVDEVSLLELHRGVRDYRWRVLARAPLGMPTPVAA